MILPSCFRLPVILSSSTLMPSTLHVSPVEGLDDSGEQLPSVESQSQPFLVVGGLLHLDFCSQAGSVSAPNPCIPCFCQRRLQDHD